MKEKTSLSAGITEVTDWNFKQEVIQSDVPVLVDFWAPWCGPCRAIAPVVEELSVDYRGMLKVAKCDVDENPKTPRKYRVKAIPTLILFKNGSVCEQITGAVAKSLMTMAIDKVIDHKSERPDNTVTLSDIRSSSNQNPQAVQIIICPQCRARFQVPDKKLKSVKTQIRCLKCNHSFVFVKNHSASDIYSAPLDKEDSRTNDHSFQKKPLSHIDEPPKPASHSATHQSRPDSAKQPYLSTSKTEGPSPTQEAQPQQQNTRVSTIGLAIAASIIALLIIAAIINSNSKRSSDRYDSKSSTASKEYEVDSRKNEALRENAQRFNRGLDAADKLESRGYKREAEAQRSQNLQDKIYGDRAVHENANREKRNLK